MAEQEKPMHTITLKTGWRICFNSDMSGDVVVNDRGGVPLARFPGELILAYVRQYVTACPTHGENDDLDCKDCNALTIRTDRKAAQVRILELKNELRETRVLFDTYSTHRWACAIAVHTRGGAKGPQPDCDCGYRDILDKLGPNDAAARKAREVVQSYLDNSGGLDSGFDWGEREEELRLAIADSIRGQPE